MTEGGEPMSGASASDAGNPIAAEVGGDRPAPLAGITALGSPRTAEGLTAAARLEERAMAAGDAALRPVISELNVISELSALRTGDLILTGTASGVGHRREPSLYLRPADRITVEVSGAGALPTTVGAGSLVDVG
jgi:hypothetical protein